jgi:phosphatidylglycerophosphate synthase
VYRFAKQIASDEPLIVETTYIKDTPFTIVKLILLLILIYGLYRKRNWLKRVWDAESGWYRKRLARHVTPLSLLIISGFLFVVSSFSLPLIFTKVLFVVLLGVVFYNMAQYLRARKERRKERKGMEIQE